MNILFIGGTDVKFQKLRLSKEHVHNDPVNSITLRLLGIKEMV